MINMPFIEVSEILKGKVLKPCDIVIAGVCIYSDFVRKNNIFFCINSLKYNSNDGGLGFTNNEDSVYGLGGVQNGHMEIQKAVENGAAVIVIDDAAYYNDNLEVGCILVEDSLQALKNLTAGFIEKMNIKVIAVTGSTGKTTTCQAIYDFLSGSINIKKIHRIRNSVLGMCIEILQNLTLEVDCYVIEMQLDGQGQIQQFCDIAKPDVAIITGINFAHYSRFLSIEKILYEKLAVYRNLKSDGFLIINDDNNILHEWANKQSDKRILKIGMKKNCDYAASEIINYGKYNFLSFSVTIKGNILINLKIKTSGTGILYATLFSFAVADMLNLPLEEFNYNATKIKTPVGRFNCFNGVNGSQILIDSYNASVDSMIQGIEYILGSSRTKKILILGSMLELAEKTESEHRRLGKLINSMNADFYIITIGEAAMYIVTEIKNISSEKLFCTFAYEDIIDILSTLSLDENTIVFMKGSGAMRMEMIAPYLLNKRIF